MPRIKMKTTAQGSSDGFTVLAFKQGEEYDVSPKLAQNFVIHQGVAEAVTRRGVVAAPENTAIEFAPKNKDTEKKNTRVFQLADELNVDSKRIIKVAGDCGVSVTAPASGLTDEEVEKIKIKMK